MKIYTEEQIRNAMRADFVIDEEIDNLINKLTPIKLPSDEEIIKQGNLISDLWEQTIYMSGAKWMRDKIQGGKK